MWGAAIDKVPHLRRLSNLDEGDWVAILANPPLPSVSYRSVGPARVMFYNKNTGEHRWEEQSDAVTLQIISDSKKGIERGTWLYRHMLSSNCEQARAYDHYPVQIDGRERTGITLAHSLPFTPLDFFSNGPLGVDWVSVLDSLPESTRLQLVGSAAADLALVRMRELDARFDPPPSSDPSWRRCASGDTALFSSVDYDEARDHAGSKEYRLMLGLEMEWWYSPPLPCGTHAIGLPKNGMSLGCALDGGSRKLTWKQQRELGDLSKSKTWRCLLTGWTESARHLLCDLGRGFSVVAREPPLPSVHRVALRVKGYPWVLAAPGTQPLSRPQLHAGGMAYICKLSGKASLNGTMVSASVSGV